LDKSLPFSSQRICITSSRRSPRLNSGAAIRVNNLGGVLRDLGDLTGARAAFERALKIDEAAFGPDHPKVARDVNNLGRVLRDLGDLAGARAAYERALKIFEKSLPPNHPNIQTVRDNLASLDSPPSSQSH
jgi:tetratricopeptide (TPR) repeat protein